MNIDYIGKKEKLLQIHSSHPVEDLKAEAQKWVREVAPIHEYQHFYLMYKASPLALDKLCGDVFSEAQPRVEVFFVYDYDRSP